MKNEKIAKVAATGILVAGFLTSFGSPVLASSNTTTVNTGAANMAAGKTIVYSITNRDTDQSILKEALADLVTAGTITQTQSDAVLTYLQQNLPQKPVLDITKPADGENESGQGPVLKIVDPLKDLVDEGTITENQVQSIRDKMRDITDQQRQQQWQTSLNTLVSDGTITQEQAGNIQAFLADYDQKIKNMKQSMLNQTKDMDKEQITQYFKENMDDIKDPVSQMVDQGIITQQQVDALKQAMPSLPHVVRMQKPSPQQLQTNLDALVSEGTITQEQADNIQVFLADNDQKMKNMKQNILDQTKDMDKEQMTQYFKENMGDIKDPVSQMVDQGIITQQQADAVREAVLGASGVAINGEAPDSGIHGGQDVFFSIQSTTSDDNQN
ncbi:hypothetical protein SAMN05660649_01352 [Desulfotomaculum arcticum]|uniref:Uncharacterized protein n=1 Tax=Desulfotruncus arcticus DSM 17038 TaxID=1121424 RepID=A0A1I2R9E6_9FIRM|nr:hypothetical protein [Desulfotruncus arcticus]SFG34501.1 hypothetical protein SAMN05660649_01352 [Desulfotomaculum arcticum] [Desulfotruncus arcticus DSM 17038]